MFDVVAIGTATRDVFVQSRLFKTVHDPDHLRRLGFATGEAECLALGAKIEVPRPVIAVGGGAANAAVTFARFSLKTACVAKVGDDRDGAAVVEDLKRETIAPFVVRDKKEGTAYSVVLLAAAGERTILNYRGASADMKISEIPFGRAASRWVHVVPGHIPFSIISAAVSRFRRRGARISLNPSAAYLAIGAKRLKPLLNAADVVFVNREEACLLTGMRWENERGMFKKFDELVRGLAVVTDGARGVLVSDGQRLFHAGTYKEKKRVDRTGAGDAFGSGFVAALSGAATAGKFSPEAIRDAIRAGSANATSVVEQIGAQAGILTARQFTGAARWKRLPIAERRIG